MDALVRRAYIKLCSWTDVGVHPTAKNLTYGILRTSPIHLTSAQSAYHIPEMGSSLACLRSAKILTTYLVSEGHKFTEGPAVNGKGEVFFKRKIKAKGLAPRGEPIKPPKPRL